VQEGQDAIFTVAAYPHRTFEARITQVRYGSSTTSGVVTYETVLKVDNSDLSLRPGMTATADITVEKIEDAVLAPTVALRFSPPMEEQKKGKKPSGGLVGSLFPRPPRSGQEHGGEIPTDKKEQHVWIIRDGKLSAVPVTTGATDGTMTEIVAGGIEPGTALVVDTIDMVS
jgi:HlyD family secretion protein